MTSLTNNLNGIASGTTVTTANSGGVSGSAFNLVTIGTGVTITAQSAAAYEGATGLQIVYPSTSTAGYVHWTISAAAGVRLSSSFYFRYSAAPANDQIVVTFGGGTIQLTTTGTLKLYTGGTLRATSPTISANSWVYVQWAQTVGTTTSDGRAEMNVILASTGATLSTYDSGAATNTGTTTVTSVQYGRTSNMIAANSLSYDLLALDNTLTSGFPGSPPVVTNTGGLKAWNGTTWTVKPVKVWTGSAWVQKPVKRWSGTSWVTLP